MQGPILFAIVFAVVGTAVTCLMLSVFHAGYTVLDVAIASTVGALLSIVPTIGPALSLLGMVLILNHRCTAALFPDIILSVAVARLAMVPALLPFAARGTKVSSGGTASSAEGTLCCYLLLLA